MSRSPWEERVRTVTPYIPGEQPQEKNIIKLNTNECPYPPAPGVAALAAKLESDKLRLYPDPATTKLSERLAQYYGLQKDQVFVGVGSDDVLSMAFLTYFHSNEPILFPDITYSFYEVWASLYRIPYQTIPLTDDFHIEPTDYHRPNGGIIFPNPNAPTGIALPLTEVEKILQWNPGVVVIVDEAYVDFGAQSARSLIESYENLLVVGTFSKSRSLAGLRIGFAFGNAKLIKYLNDTKYSVNSYTMNIPSQVLGVAALEDEDYFQSVLKRVMQTREETKERLQCLGFKVLDSCCNFLFATHPQLDADQLTAALRAAKIYVRHWNKPRIEQYLRITIGTPEEMNALVDFLEKYQQNV
ncbi:MAG: histidinol-phosphate transaminase [Clostridium sp.]|jgi:histidinol-phosphate aminotransferase|nr:histidinol-phosphate transaminase [Clostridium sp.]